MSLLCNQTYKGLSGAPANWSMLICIKAHLITASIKAREYNLKL